MNWFEPLCALLEYFLEKKLPQIAVLILDEKFYRIILIQYYEIWNNDIEWQGEWFVWLFEEKRRKL